VSTARTAAVLQIIGAAVFGVGAAIGVPQVFTEGQPNQRLRMLKEHLGIWRTAQPFYGRPVIASVGVGYLAADAADRATRTLLVASCTALGIGAVAWAWSLYLRTTRISEFAFRTLPGWPFVTYVLLTIGGLALLSIVLSTGGSPAWLGWPALAADILFLALYLRFKDIPPFAFYVLLLVVGLATV
jgi:hypothetical protein